MDCCQDVILSGNGSYFLFFLHTRAAVQLHPNDFRGTLTFQLGRLAWFERRLCKVFAAALMVTSRVKEQRIPSLFVELILVLTSMAFRYIGSTGNRFQCGNTNVQPVPLMCKQSRINVISGVACGPCYTILSHPYTQQ